jgi:hypothetical protein
MWLDIPTTSNTRRAFCPLCNPKITEFQNEYVDGDDFRSEFLDEILELKARVAINAMIKCASCYRQKFIAVAK